MIRRWSARVGGDLRWTLGAGVAAVVVVVLGVALVAASGTNDPRRAPTKRAGVGSLYSLFSTSNPQDPVGAVTVRVPTGATRITVLAHTDSAEHPAFPTVSSDHDYEVRAPSGGSLVTVRSVPVAATSGSATTVGAAVDGPSFALLADGRRYPLGLPSESTDDAGPGLTTIARAADVAVGVVGHPEHFVLEAVFDHDTQTFDLMNGRRSLGRAAPLYSPAAPSQAGCGTVDSDYDTIARGAVPATCRIQLSTMPWTSFTGWAPMGKAIAVASLQYSPPSLVRGRYGSGYTTQPGPPVVQISGPGVQESWVPVEGGGADAADVGTSVSALVDRTPVIPGTRMPVQVMIEYHLELVGPRADGDPYSSFLHLTWSTTLG